MSVRRFTAPALLLLLTVAVSCGSEAQGPVAPGSDPSWRVEHPVSGGNLLAAAWAAGDDDVFAVGNGGTILRYDGSAWQHMDSGTDENLTGVWGLSASQVYATGFNGTVLRYDGTSWHTEPTPSVFVIMTDVWASSSSDVYAVGHQSTVFHYDGTGWSSTHVEPLSLEISARKVSSSGAPPVSLEYQR